MERHTTYHYIIRAIEEHVQKCSVTMKGVREQIEPVIRTIARSEKEYDRLMEHIPRFYRDTYKAERKHFVGVQGETVWAEEGSEGWYSETHDLKEAGKRDGFQLMMINNTTYDGGHPLPDGMDFRRQRWYDGKAMVICGDNGITITTNNTKVVDYPSRSNLMNFIHVEVETDLGRERRVESRNSAELAPLKEQHVRTVAGSKNNKRLAGEIRTIVNNDLNQNVEGEVAAINKSFEDNGFDWQTTYIPLKKTYE